MSLCPKCSGHMDLGSSEGPRGFQVWFKGTKFPDSNIHLFPPRLERTTEVYRVAVYRCSSCGFLEAYAKDPV